MRLRSTFAIALRALRRHKLRSALTALGIIIGVGAVIAMVGIGTGAKMQVEAQIASLGQNVVLVFPGTITRGGVFTGWGGAGTLRIEDAEAIRREIPQVIAVSPEDRTTAQVAAGNQNWMTQILGESEQYLEIRSWPLADGVMFTEQDVRGATKVAVIGKTVADQLFAGQDALGQILRIRDVPFVVIGVLSPKGISLLGQDQDDVVIVPYTSAMKRITGRTTLRAILAQATSPAELPVVQNQIIELLRERHRIGPEREDDFTVRTQQEIAEMATATSRILAALLGSIAGVSLLVGGIGIMNIMLVSVTERTREIGIRLAVGAHPRDILQQFLIEAITLSSLGGALGIVLGLAASRVLSQVAGWPTQTPWIAVVGGFLFSAAIGIFFGFYPARKASRLDPIEALRYE